MEAVDIRLEEIEKLNHMQAMLTQVRQHLAADIDDKGIHLLNELANDLAAITEEKDLTEESDDMVFF
ncbi:hypothetical protein HR060_10415 [Catenovulum sp. SM1970]|uniref:hypothetical protein n=1 Tax=Marinifaba aquimaris TaxID=2741323 RepID=UPI0015747099|nr:hypothetical protein [Marinifaba aquimaris]NTS77277.1 hypothetical protein [Marinifaba aquimaris]